LRPFTSDNSRESSSLTVLIPARDDGAALSRLLIAADDELAGKFNDVSVLVVDDCSERRFAESGVEFGPFVNFEKVSVLELKRNLGHQRAISLGLTYVDANVDTSIVLVMDGDGEDRPNEAVRLVDRCRELGNSKIIFAGRTRRSEGFLFRAFYFVYKLLYRILTGRNYHVGNFSAIPAKFLSRLSVISEGWNHYASSVLKARIPFEEIETVRGNRLDGRSKMNFTSLVIHGLSAISVHSEVVGVRMLYATLSLTMASLILVAVVVAIRLFTEMAVPGWATYVTAFLAVILLQSVTLSFFFSFIVLSGRENATFLPERDYHYFIAGELTIFERRRAGALNA
jgi:glycosyltransferase involved in cell wall biosynthesis